MKPIKLIIEGINSFTDAQTLDFDAVGGCNLFCISGKTGAGKTTIFDSIMLALYGKSPKGSLADIVNLSLMRASVALEFSENGEVYRVERNIKCSFEKDADGKPTEKRKASADCMLYRNGQPEAKGEAANAKLMGIIGMEAAEFKNVYLLEQGEYADFLKKPPAKQTEAVGKIFSLMRFGDVYKLAGEKAKECRARKDNSAARIAELGDVSPERLKEIKDALKSMRAKTTTLKNEAETKQEELAVLEKQRTEYIAVSAKMKAVKDLMLQSDEAKKRIFETKSELEEFEKTVDREAEDKLSALRADLNRLSALAERDRQYAEATAEHAKKTEQVEDYRAKLCTAQSEYDKLKAECEALGGKLNDIAQAVVSEIDGGESKATLGVKAVLSGDEITATAISDAAYALSAEKTEFDGFVARAKEAEKRIAEKSKECENILARIDRYNAEYSAINNRIEAFTEAVEAAKAALSAAQLASHAAAVRSELHDGDVCPVCGGAYHGGDEGESDDVEAKKRELEGVEKKLKAETTRKSECEKYTDMAKADYSRADGDKKAAEREKSELEEKIKNIGVVPELYEKLKAALDRLKSVESVKRLAEGKLLKKEPELTSIKAALSAAEKAAEEGASKAAALKQELGEHCGKTAEAVEKVAAETEAFEKKLKKTEDVRKSLSAAVTSAQAASEAIDTSLEKAKAECPVDMPQFDEEAYEEKKASVDNIRLRISETERDIAAREVEEKYMTDAVDNLTKWQTELKEHEKQAKIYDTICELTRGKAMLNYVAAEYIAEFTAIASEILIELSGGKYTMRYDSDNGFIVSDYLNNGKWRKTDTLSGGEMFLASLSVAIAIARTQSTGSNAFFFLDEGFGTLDEELIDVVYSALESLSKDCLVGVITHAEALIARMPYCVKVQEASDAHGSRIVY